MNSCMRFFGVLALIARLCTEQLEQALGHSPVDFLEVIRVKPAQVIEHGVETQEPL